MGASNIEFDIPDGPSSKVLDAFNKRQKEDRSENGSQQGYSGDFQTVEDVKIHDKTFNDYTEAHDYCMNNAEKWEYVVAVKYRDFSHLKNKKENSIRFMNNELVSKKLLTLRERLKDETEAEKKLLSKIRSGIKEAKSKTIGCKNCESQINRKYVKDNLTCPCCNKTLLSPTAQKQVQTKKDKLTLIKKQEKEELNKLKDKNAKLSKTRWLVAGWGAS